MEEQNIELIDKGKVLLPRTTTDNVELRGFEVLKEPIGLCEKGENINGLSLTDFIKKAILKDWKPFKFLHLSDTHGSDVSVKKADELLKADNSLRFAVITGDIEMNESIAKIVAQNDKIWVMLGNHDRAGGQKNQRDTVIAPYMTTRAHMGDDAEVGSWWYQDVENIRFIAFDEYEDSIPLGLYQVRYTKKQMDWFINLLMTTPPNYYIVLFHHQPVSIFRDTSKMNLFVSEKNPSIYEFQDDRNDPATVIPQIMEAYLNKKKIDKDFEWGTVVHLTADFTQITPAKFIAHMGGHTHWDCHEYLPLYPKQLQLLIDCAKPDKYSLSDLNRNTADSHYCINEYSIDLSAEKIHVKRIGAHITDSRKDRNYISFSFKR